MSLSFKGSRRAENMANISSSNGFAKSATQIKLKFSLCVRLTDSSQSIPYARTSSTFQSECGW